MKKIKEELERIQKELRLIGYQECFICGCNPSLLEELIQAALEEREKQVRREIADTLD